MKTLALIVAFSGFVSMNCAIQESIHDEEKEESVECCSCSDGILSHDSHFQYDPEHLVCIHCYFYRIPRTEDSPALYYICKNGNLLEQ
jgi:hypothetical protein